jgi:hypothetical protein
MGQAKKRGTREQRVEAARMTRAIEGVTHEFICEKCGTNRLELPCPGDPDQCVMLGRTISIPIEDDGIDDLCDQLGISRSSEWENEEHK